LEIKFDCLVLITADSNTFWVADELSHLLDFNKLSLNEAIEVAQKHPLWRFGTMNSWWCMPEKNE